MARKKKLDLEQIPRILEKAVALVDRELDALAEKSSLNTEESKILIAYVGTLSDLHKDYRQQVVQYQKNLRELSTEELDAMIKAEVHAN